jgi:SAM-dependent methyltransferase
VNIAVSELSNRYFELPQKGVPFALVVPSGAPLELPTKTNDHAGSHSHGDKKKGKAQRNNWSIQDVFEDCRELWETAKEVDYLSTHVAHVATRLWSPVDVLEENIERIEDGRIGKGLTALDVGCGSGRDVAYLASRGWNCVALDNLDKALLRCSALARRMQCRDRLEPVQLDVRKPASSRSLLHRSSAVSAFDLVLVVRFIHRPLFPMLCKCLAKGGVLVYAHFLEDVEENLRADDDAAATRTTGRLPPTNSAGHVTPAGAVVDSDSAKRLKNRAKKWPEEKKPLKRGELLTIIGKHAEWDVLLLDEDGPACPGIDQRPFVRLVARKISD